MTGPPYSMVRRRAVGGRSLARDPRRRPRPHRVPFLRALACWRTGSGAGTTGDDGTCHARPEAEQKTGPRPADETPRAPRSTQTSGRAQDRRVTAHTPQASPCVRHHVCVTMCASPWVRHHVCVTAVTPRPAHLLLHAQRGGSHTSALTPRLSPRRGAGRAAHRQLVLDRAVGALADLDDAAARQVDRRAARGGSRVRV